MFLKLRPLFFSLFFLASLEFLVLKHNQAPLVAIVLFLVSFFEGKSIGKKWRYSILPVFFTLSTVAQLYLINLSYEQQVFVFLASFMYYLSLFGAYRLGQYSGDKTARGMNMAATSATIFFTYASFYGLYLNFLVPLYWLMLAYMFTTLLVSYQHFIIIHPRQEEGDESKRVWIYSFLLSLAMTELIWAMNFWPFGYLTTGTIALILYYILWDVIQSHFLNLLSRKRVLANIALFSVLIGIILLSSKWIPVI